MKIILQKLWTFLTNLECRRFQGLSGKCTVDKNASNPFIKEY